MSIVLRKPTESEIKRILFDDDIWDRETDDNSPYKEAIQALPDVDYIGGYVNGEIIGLFITYAYKDGIKLHFMVLKAFRRYARDFLSLALCKINKPVYSIIPDRYQSVINFAKHSGFDEIGIDGDFIKCGHVYNRIVLCHS